MRLRVIGWSVGAAALAVVIASLGWGLTHPANKAPATLVGAPAPALAIRTFDGVEYDLGQLRGTPIVINFWASWCVACRLEAPVLRAAANRYAGRIQFLGIECVRRTDWLPPLALGPPTGRQHTMRPRS